LPLRRDARDLCTPVLSSPARCVGTSPTKPSWDFRSPSETGVEETQPICFGRDRGQGQAGRIVRATN